LNYEIRFSKLAAKDIKTLSPKLKEKVKNILIEVISENPHAGKKLLGELSQNFSYRINLKDRLVYSIEEENKIVYIKRARTHYGQ